MSYKKLSKCQTKSLNEEHFRKMIDSALVLQSLEKMEVEEVYVDKFSFDPRKTRLSRWGLVGKRILFVQRETLG